MKKFSYALTVKLFLLKLFIGAGFIHLKKHEPHIHYRSAREISSQEYSRNIKDTL